TAAATSHCQRGSRRCMLFCPYASVFEGLPQSRTLLPRGKGGSVCPVCRSSNLTSAATERNSADVPCARCCTADACGVRCTRYHCGRDANFRYPLRSGSCSISESRTAGSMLECSARVVEASHWKGRRDRDTVVLITSR